MQGSNVVMNNVLFDELTDKHALKYHGYFFSDEEDGSTNSESELDEERALYKPPPLIIPREKLVVIKALTPNKLNTKHTYLQDKNNNLTRKKQFPQRNKQKIEVHFKITLNNSYEALEQSDNDEYSKDSETENKSQNDNVNNAEIKKKKRRKRKRRLENKTLIKEPFINALTGCLLDKGNSNEVIASKAEDKFEKKSKEKINILTEHCEEAFITDLDYFLSHISWFLWNEDIFMSLPLKKKAETYQTSWDYISTNNVYRSDKLIEQEYYNIVGAKLSRYNDFEMKRKTALKNLLDVTGTPCVFFIFRKFLNALDSEMYLNVIGILIAAYVYTRYK